MKRKKWLLLIPPLVIVAVATLAYQHFTLNELIAHELELRQTIRRHPWTAASAGVVLYAVLSLIPGTTGKALIAGWLFGTWIGSFVVNVGLTLAAVATFLFSRLLLRDALEQRFTYQVSWINKAVDRDGATYLLMLRILHCPYTMTNYVFGATSMPLMSFWWATQLGMLPGNLVFAYAGSQFPSLQQIANGETHDLLSWELAFALILLSVFPWIVKSAVRRWRRRGTTSDVPPPVLDSSANNGLPGDAG